MNKVIAFVAVLAVCVLPSCAAYRESDCLFVSHLTGDDSSKCGTSVRPCRTLPHALQLVPDGGKIFLDGRNSKSHPYGCLKMVDPHGEKLKPINKNVSIQGQFSKAHISCKNRDGLTFGTNFINGSIKVTLSNLAFDKYGVSFFNVCSFNVVITKCRFINCPIGVGMRQVESSSDACQRSSLVVTDSEFWYNKKSVFVFLLNEFFSMSISRCHFQGKGVNNDTIMLGERNLTGAVEVISTRPRKLKWLHVVGLISNSTFQELGFEDDSFALAIHDYFFNGYWSLLNTSLIKNGYGIFMYGGFVLRLIKVTINSTFGNSMMLGSFPKVQPWQAGFEVLLDQCILTHNIQGILMAVQTCSNGLSTCPTGEQTLVVKNNLFLDGPFIAIATEVIKFVVKSTGLPWIQYNVKLLFQNVSFEKMKYPVLSVDIGSKVRGIILVKKCKFLNNDDSGFLLEEESSVVKMKFADNIYPKCRKREGNKSSEFTWEDKSQLPTIFEDTIFEGNVGLYGALSFINGNVSFNRCSFKDNGGLTLGGHLVLRSGFGNLNIINSTFLQTNLGKFSQIPTSCSFLYSESVGPLVVKNTAFIARVNRKFYPTLAVTMNSLINIDGSSSLQCPTGKQVILEKTVKKQGIALTDHIKHSSCWMSIYNVKLFCDECPGGFYNLESGSTNGLDINNGTECSACPYGASCDNGNIVAKENFWGFRISARLPKLKFIPCPMDYCKAPTHAVNHSYNGCHGSRTGVLCGQCSDGYSEVLYSTSCRRKEKCNDYWFWVASFIYVMVFALYVVFKPPIFSLLYRQSLWFKKIPHRGSAQAQPNKNSSGEHDKGYLKIVFYFYQVAELVMIKSPETALHMVPFITPVVAIFNFQVKTVNGSIGCPFPGLTVVTKGLFKCLKFLATLFSIAFIYVIHRGISKAWDLSTPSLALYLAVALETLLLGYETLAETTLNLMHCVHIGLEWRLFVDGNIQCWQWWQYLFILFIVVFVIPLILVLFWGSLMLSKDKLSAKEFLTSCAFPLPFLLIWLFRYCRKTANPNPFELLRGNSHNADEIKKVLHDPFRPAANGNHGTLYWESVLTGRRFLLLTIHTFATDSMVRYVCLNCACVLILLHHLISRPFRDRKANICESISLVSLVAICTFNLAEVTIISEGQELTGPSKNFFLALQWIQIALLGTLPGLACILVMFAILSQVVRLVYHCVKILYKFAPRALSLCPSLRPRRDLIMWDSDEIFSVT